MKRDLCRRNHVEHCGTGEALNPRGGTMQDARGLEPPCWHGSEAFMASDDGPRTTQSSSNQSVRVTCTSLHQSVPGRRCHGPLMSACQSPMFQAETEIPQAQTSSTIKAPIKTCNRAKRREVRPSKLAAQKTEQRAPQPGATRNSIHVCTCKKLTTRPEPFKAHRGGT